MKRKNKINLIIITALIIILGCTMFLGGCNNQSKTKEIVLATTTSTENTGLLDAIIPEFTKKTGIAVKVVAVGSGQAMEMGKNGEADVLLVHAKASEEKFVSEGYGIKRYDVMYNDFVLVGPQNASKVLPDKYKADIVGALNYLRTNKITFVSRGDNSGTHQKENSIWQKASVEPSGDWYISAGKGMGDVLQMANELKAYTLTDRGTYLSMKDNLELKIIVEKDKDLFNQYGVIAVNPEKNPNVHSQEAQQFIDWILSKETQELIGNFGTEKFGQPLFIPNAK